jgi:hypothetical protein
VGNGLDGDTFWLVAAHGDPADYVRNLRAQPRVRYKAIGRKTASAPLTVRIDLDPGPGQK